jgi:hypothetical protein
MIYRIMNEDGTEASRSHIIFYGNPGAWFNTTTS